MTNRKDQRIDEKHQRKFSLSLPLSLGVNGSHQLNEIDYASEMVFPNVEANLV